jgi:hypothetical protein
MPTIEKRPLPPPNAAYSPAGNFYGIFPRASAIATTPSPSVFDASRSSLLLRGPTAPNLPGDDMQGIDGSKPQRRLSRRIVDPSPAAPIGAMPDNSAASGNENGRRYVPLGGLPWDGNKSRAPAIDAGAPATPVDSPDTANYPGGLLGTYLALGLDPENPNKPAPPSPDDEQEQGNLRELDARLSRTGDIRDAVALYKARIASRARGTFDQA